MSIEQQTRLESIKDKTESMIHLTQNSQSVRPADKYSQRRNWMFFPKDSFGKLPPWILLNDNFDENFGQYDILFNADQAIWNVFAQLRAFENISNLPWISF